jgi:uncharacterized protein (TIGR00369 family)
MSYPSFPASGDGLAPLRDDAFAAFLGLRWDEPTTARLTIRPELVNAAGLLLGPVGFTLVDYAMTSTLWQQTAEDEAVATINISINFISSAKHGDVACHATLDRRNRSTAVLTSETRHEDGRLLATAIGSFYIFRPRPA